MAGRTHTTHTPHRMNDVLGRDALGFVARQTVATQDLRKAIYVGPYGKGYHRVRNPFSGEVYVVADGLGGATVEPDSVVMVASFSGAHGEVLVTRPPAGFGGAATSAVTRTPYRALTAVDTGVPPDGTSYFPLGFCWSTDGNLAIIARRKTVVSPPSATVEFVKIQRSAIPHLNIYQGTAFCAMDDCSVYGMQYGTGGGFYVFRSDGAGSVGGTVNYLVTSINNSGTITAEINYDVETIYTLSTFFSGGDLYSVESKVGLEPGGGPPYDSWARIVQRDGISLAVLNSYDIPNPVSYDGWTLRRTDCICIADNGGTVRAYIAHTKQPDISQAKAKYQDFDSSLSPSGASVVFGSGTIGGLGDDPMGHGNLCKEGLSSGNLVFIGNYQLATRAFDGSSPSVVLASYNSDFGEDFGIEVISSTEVLVMGLGSVFTTSILSASGQELP